MSLTVQVLGDPGRDNAVLMHLDSGQSVTRLLFDCGDGCVSRLPVGTVQEIDHVFFSHFHMDHVAGFDAFFRCTYNRTAKPNRLWGPPGSADVLSHRFRGYLWNLHAGQTVPWFVHEIHDDRVRTTRFALDEAFARPHAEGERPRGPAVLDAEDFTVEALTMNHGRAAGAVPPLGPLHRGGVARDARGGAGGFPRDELPGVVAAGGVTARRFT